jgi:N-acetylmuramoyl-L-alanine amidase
MAQAGSVKQSLTLADGLAAALKQGGVPVVVGRAPLRPLDNLMCPAVALEIAPLAAGGGDTTPAADAGYQQRVADAVAAALNIWRDQNFPPVVRPAPSPKGQP